tara:strand:+ start:1213 stop:1422 length:210 start_codon:yes stop_codon:yes gene_type:complete
MFFIAFLFLERRRLEIGLSRNNLDVELPGLEDELEILYFFGGNRQLADVRHEREGVGHLYFLQNTCPLS